MQREIYLFRKLGFIKEREMNMVGQSNSTFWYKKFKREIYTYYYLLVDPATPAYFKFLPLLVFIAYFLFPFDLLPDFIPFIGYVDDVAFLLLGHWIMFHAFDSDGILERLSKKRQKKRSHHPIYWNGSLSSGSY